MSFEAMSRHRALPRPPFDGSQKRLTLEVGFARDGGVRNGDGSPGDGGQPAAWGLPRRAGSLVPAGVAMGVRDLRHFPHPGGRRGPALVTLSSGGGVAALRLDGGVTGLRSRLPLPHRGPDIVFTLEPGAWLVPFQISSLLLVATSGLGVLVGGWAVLRFSRLRTPSQGPVLTEKGHRWTRW